jgi:hypothetical protein
VTLFITLSSKLERGSTVPTHASLFFSYFLTTPNGAIAALLTGQLTHGGTENHAVCIELLNEITRLSIDILRNTAVSADSRSRHRRCLT